MIEGSCLCKGVRYQAGKLAGPMANCHCGMCQKAHGTAFATILPVAKSEFRWTDGQELVSDFESSPGKRRWFCSRCGSHLISTRDDNNESLLLRAGSIDRGCDVKPVAHAWVAVMAPWFELSDDLPRFDRGFPGAPPGVE
jgi:hypothetical protein